MGIVEGNEDLVEKTGLLFARSVVQQNSNTIPLRVINVNEEPIKVYENTLRFKKSYLWMKVNTR